MPASNSFSDMLTQLSRNQKNVLEILRSLSKIVRSDKENVEINVEIDDGSVQTFKVPSTGFLLDRIQRAEKSIENLSGLNQRESNIRLPDGSFRKVIVSRPPSSPSKLTNLETPSRFNIQNNWFFEQFLNPQIFVSFDGGNQIPVEATQIAYKRFILQLNTDQKQQFYDNNIDGRNDISYNQFLINLQNNGIQYFVDEDTIDLPLNILTYKGNFGLVSSFTEKVTEIVDGEEQTVTRRKYKLSTLEYQNNITGEFLNLKVNDSLLLNKDKATRFQIKNIEPDRNVVELKRLEGFETPSIGANTFSISSSIYSNQKIQIPIGFDEYNVVFMKPVSPNFQIAANEWSDGVAFYSNDLVIKDGNVDKNFETFYKENVLDFGKQIMDFAENQTIPSSESVLPDPPSISQDNFRVVSVNDHKENSGNQQEIERKFRRKNQLKSEIEELEQAIDKQKNKIATKNYNSSSERQKDVSRKNELISEKNSKTNLFNSLVTELASFYREDGEVLKKKYRIRGFWEIPEPKETKSTKPQEIVQFQYRYRYLGQDGNSSGAQEFKFQDQSGVEKQGSFSNWIEVKTPFRERIVDPDTGEKVWKTQNENDSDENNINQLDIPITQNEQVEIQIRSISEAGYPQDPAKSEYTESVIVEFPEELQQQNQDSIRDQVLSEESKVQFSQELNARGIDQHLEDQTVQNEQLIVHKADTIDSLFKRTDGSIINLFDKLKQMEEEITSLQNSLGNVIGSIEVSIVDNDNNEFSVQNNSLVKIFSGYYKDIVNTFSIKKGAIVTRVYNIVIKNVSATPIELLSYFAGNRETKVPNYDANKVQQGEQPTDYRLRQYGKTPIGLTGLEQANVLNENNIDKSTSLDSSEKLYKNITPFQSAQSKGQFIYSRFNDVGLTENLYIKDSTNINNNGFLVPDFTGSQNTAGYIWDGTFDSNTNLPNGNGNKTDFCVHVDHPELQQSNPATGEPKGKILNIFQSSPSNYEKEFSFIPPEYINTNDVIQYPIICHSQFFNIPSDEANGKKQLAYFSRDNSNNYYNTSTGEIDSSNIANDDLKAMPRKLGFYESDQYLIGSNTCGSYLFLAPAQMTNIQVNKDNFLGVKEVETGDSAAVNIPIVFQARLTDYDGSSNTGFGRIGGKDGLTNVTYSKKIGIDIQLRNNELFSFDFETSMTYKRES
jgi:hypothetical protein